MRQFRGFVQQRYMEPSSWSKYKTERVRTLRDILEDIASVKQKNDERIQRINNNPTVNTFQYLITQSTVNNCFKFGVNELQVKQDSSVVTKAWRVSGQIIAISDIFNDKLNYSCETYADLVRLNSEMYTVAEKYELFGDSEKARQEALKFLKNFQLIETNLKQIEESVQQEESKLEELKNKVNDINSQLEKLMTEYKNLSFGNASDIPTGQVSCFKCGNKPTIMKYYVNNAAPTRNDGFRVNGYSATCTGCNYIEDNWIFAGIC